MAKKREVDFSQEEMLKLTGLTRKQFRDALLRFCDMYDFKLVDFKVDETNEKSDFYFAPEIAEPLALMLKHIMSHPLYRKNADLSNITATSMAEYNEKLLKDIDETLPEYFNHAVYSLPGQLVAQEISAWSAAFVRELTHFMYNLSRMEMQDIGATLKLFTRRLNEMNYYLYRGNYSMIKNIELNKKHDMETYGLPDDSDIDKKLQKPNLSIDRLLAELIRWEMEGAHKMRDIGFPELKEILDYENARLKMLGVKCSLRDKEGMELFVDIPKPTNEQQREAYYSFVLGKTIDEGRCMINKDVAKKMKDYREAWKPIDQKISEGTFEGSTLKGEYKRAVQEEMEKLQSRMNQLQAELDCLDGKEKVPFAFETDDDLKERQSSYVTYCKEIDTKESRLYDIVDHFVGQAMNEFLK